MKTDKASKSRGKKIPVPVKKKSTGLQFSSNAKAESEAAKLRQNREELESEPPTGENDARATLL